ncbi:hypothetical protein JA1_002829 [Spathaspora sp. JA1]|nr:hypothetical protein JA1_002829 [Spathaspora sp. JA1]
MPYKLTILQGSANETQKSLQTHLKRISLKHPYFSKAHIISNTSPSKPASKITRTTTTKLWDIINDTNTSYVFAKPIGETNINPELSFTNTLEFNRGKVRIVLHQDKFQMIPNLKNSAKVRKLTEDKVGHGGNYFVKYRYLIEMDRVKPALKQIIDIVFSEVEMITLAPGEVQLHQDAVELVDLQDLDNFEIYECLSLIVNVDKANIVTDDNFSRYGINWNNQFENKYTSTDIGSNWITQLSQDWSILSLHNDTNHTLIYRDLTSTYIWEITI